MKRCRKILFTHKSLGKPKKFDPEIHKKYLAHEDINKFERFEVELFSIGVQAIC